MTGPIRQSTGERAQDSFVESPTRANKTAVEVFIGGSAIDLGSASGSNKSFISICRNNTDSTIVAGSVVYISGATGNKATISLSQANSEEKSSKTFGIVKSDIVKNADGEIVVIGELSGLNTSSFSDGDSLWLSPDFPGGMTNVRPSAPNHAVFIGTVVYAHNNNGIIQINIQNGYELDELHNVSIQAPQMNQSLIYDGSIWANKTTEFEFIQSTASNTWTINHNLGFKPTVTVFSVGGLEVEADVQHTSVNQTIIYFNNPFAGSARLT